MEDNYTDNSHAHSHTSVPVNHIILPSNNWHQMAGKKPSILYCYETIETNEVNTIRKRMRIDLDEKKISYSVNNLLSKTEKLPPSLPITFDSFEQLNEMLKMVNSIPLCEGITSDIYHCVGDKHSDHGFFENGVWRSNEYNIFKC